IRHHTPGGPVRTRSWSSTSRGQLAVGPRATGRGEEVFRVVTRRRRRCTVGPAVAPSGVAAQVPGLEPEDPPPGVVDPARVAGETAVVEVYSRPDAASPARHAGQLRLLVAASHD